MATSSKEKKAATTGKGAEAPKSLFPPELRLERPTTRSEGRKAGRAYVLFEFGEMFSGDCMIGNGSRLVFHDNGTGTYDARLRSTDDDDTWHLRFAVFRAEGPVVVEIPGPGPTWYWTKDMPDDDTWYDWHIDFRYDAGTFRLLHHASAYGYC